MTNTNPLPHGVQSIPEMSDFDLTGISQEIIDKAGLEPTVPPNNIGQYGIGEMGMLIPYRSIYGDPIWEGDLEFARVRLASPSDDKKYSQRLGTGIHSYVTPNLISFPHGGTLYAIEGEKKALSLASAGYPAVGLPGFYGFLKDEGLTLELEEVLAEISPIEVVFVGDTDVVFNSQFSDAAHKLAKLLANRFPVSACALPLDAPGKGVDDCRGSLGEESFNQWFEGVIANRISICSDYDKGRIALKLLSTQSHLFKVQVTDDDKEAEIHRGLVKLAARSGCSLTENKIKDVAVSLGLPARTFNSGVKRQRAKDSSVEASILPGVLEIDLTQPHALWVDHVLKSVGSQTYVTGGDVLGELTSNSINPFTAAGFCGFVDDPKFRQFVKTDHSGQKSRIIFEEKHARIVLQSVMRHLPRLRPVRTLSQFPLLILSSDGNAEMVTDYNSEKEILVLENNHEDWNQRPEVFGTIAELLNDFDFLPDGSYTRALSMIITPALVRGGFLGKGRPPLFAITKDEVGTGASFLCKLLSLLYGSNPYSIVPTSDKQLQEAISDGIIKGHNLITLDNVRGTVLNQCPSFESMLTEPVMNARCLYVQKQVNVENTMFMVNSNGMQLSSDLADRTVEIGLRKKPENYQFASYPAGGIVEHLEQNRGRYLRAIYGAIYDWIKEGRRSGTTTGLRFSEWESAASGIVETRFARTLRLYPRGKIGRDQSKARLSCPHLEMISEVCSVVMNSGAFGRELAVGDISSLLGESLLELDLEPGKASRKLGTILKKSCREDAWTSAGEGIEILMTRASSKSTNNQIRWHYSFRKVVAN